MKRDRWAKSSARKLVAANLTQIEVAGEARWLFEIFERQPQHIHKAKKRSAKR